MLEKNQLHTVDITDYNSDGLGVCHIEGQTVFVRGGVRDETCVARILKVSPKVAWAKLERIETPSPYRIQAECDAYPLCGGCDCQHICYAEEVTFKRGRVEQAMKRLGGVDISLTTFIEASQQSAYRNKALFPVSRVNGAAVTGFYRAGSHQLVSTENCTVNMPQANACAAATREYLDEQGVSVRNPETGKGLVRHLFVRVTNHGTQVALVINGSHLPNWQLWVEKLQSKCEDIRGILEIENRRNDNVILGDGPVRVLWGEELLLEQLGGLTIALHPLGFAQVNTAQAVTLYDLAVEYAGLTPEDVVIDLYCGAGALSMWLAKHCRRVHGIEVVPQSVESARGNALRNKVENVTFHLGDAGTVAAELTTVKPDVITVDPPRGGLETAAIDAIATLSPKRIVYVSCDPGTLARDIKRLRDHGYEVQKYSAVDLFPRTRHVEVIVSMTRCGSDKSEE